ncbi:hypothetical protein [Ruegeria arenilitoris]|uniref:hypothetical protein n=1 Tax=Ruegeria arenilitoris TaxID=1173585 RepID=UPI00147E590E|nr:hypothetical protein [Ruegeria arenilitoris]
MHRKFIALIVATAVIVTGISASKARAADAKDILGGLAAIAIVGAALHHYSKQERRERKQAITRAPRLEYNKPSRRYPSVRPLPDRVARYDLPRRCLRTYDNYSNSRPLLGPNCLSKYYKHAKKLPSQCEVGFWNGKKVKRAYEPACLRQYGYRVVY